MAITHDSSEDPLQPPSDAHPKSGALADYRLEFIDAGAPLIPEGPLSDSPADLQFEIISPFESANQGTPAESTAAIDEEAFNAPSDRSAEQGEIWLNGDVLACLCPDCGSIMSIRLWLMLADCWICGASVELTAEQERQAENLIRERNARIAAAAAQGSSAAAPSREDSAAGARAPLKSPAEEVASGRVSAAEPNLQVRKRLRQLRASTGLLALLSSFLNDLPAWVVSLVVHVVILLILSMLTEMLPKEEEESITLATVIAVEDLPAEATFEVEVVQEETFEFEEPTPVVSDQDAQRQVAAEMTDIVTPDFEPEPPEDPMLNAAARMPEVIRHLPPMNLNTPGDRPPKNMFAGRDPRIREKLTIAAGGSDETEVAVTRALQFLSRHQAEDGRWSLDKFHKSPDCDATCKDTGSRPNDVAGTSLALLPFLGAGHTHKQGHYQEPVLHGLEWLLRTQKEDGDLRGTGERTTLMYAHGQASIVLCEAYAMTGDPNLQEGAQRSVNFIVSAQHHLGGWRYSPGEAGDTSVVGWQVMALQSGRQVGNLVIPQRTFDRANLFLDSVQRDEVGGRYAYEPGRRDASPAMTAEGMLCRLYLGWPTTHQGIRSGVKYMLKENPPDAEDPNIYYWYYATQVMHHVGGDAWDEWNTKMTRVLIDTQTDEGHSAGSWTPEGKYSSEGGRLYVTSLSTCILEVYYRHMPLHTEEMLPTTANADDAPPTGGLKWQSDR